MTVVITPNRPDVVDESFGEEAVLVNLRTGRYYSLENTAGQLWGAIAPGGATLGDVAAVLGVADAAVAPFVQRLADEELVTLDGALPDADVPLAPEQEPRLLVFTDMADILQLDPIHDIDLDGTGWPASVKPEAA